MATTADPKRLSVAPFTTQQRQRLEAVTAARTLLLESRWIDNRREEILPPLEALLTLATYITTGETP